jgi:GcrA cell cycle regulator
MTSDIASDNPRSTSTTSTSTTSTWTTERVAMLRTYFNAGLSCAQIASEIGVSRNAVIGKMNRLGLSRGRRTASPGAARPSGPRRPHVLTQRLALKALFAAEPVVTDVVSTEPCSLFNLTARKCRWPIGAVGTPDFNFCGNSTADGVSYCAGHARMAYRFSPRAQDAPARHASQGGQGSQGSQANQGRTALA